MLKRGFFVLLALGWLLVSLVVFASPASASTYAASCAPTANPQYFNPPVASYVVSAFSTIQPDPSSFFGGGLGAVGCGIADGSGSADAGTGEIAFGSSGGVSVASSGANLWDCAVVAGYSCSAGAAGYGFACAAMYAVDPGYSAAYLQSLYSQYDTVSSVSGACTGKYSGVGSPLTVYRTYSPSFGWSLASSGVITQSALTTEVRSAVFFLAIVEDHPLSSGASDWAQVGVVAFATGSGEGLSPVGCTVSTDLATSTATVTYAWAGAPTGDTPTVSWGDSSANSVLTDPVAGGVTHVYSNLAGSPFQIYVKWSSTGPECGGVADFYHVLSPPSNGGQSAAGCAPTGFGWLDPAALVQALGCLVQWAVVPPPGYGLSVPVSMLASVPSAAALMQPIGSVYTAVSAVSIPAAASCWNLGNLGAAGNYGCVSTSAFQPYRVIVGFALLAFVALLVMAFVRQALGGGGA